VARIVDNLERVTTLGSFRGWLGEPGRMAIWDRGAAVPIQPNTHLVWAFEDVAALLTMSEKTYSGTQLKARGGGGMQRTRTTNFSLYLRIVTADGDTIQYRPVNHAEAEHAIKLHVDACQESLLSKAAARLAAGVPCAFGRATLHPDGTVTADAGTATSREFWKPTPETKMQQVDLKGAQQFGVEGGKWRASRKHHKVMGKPDCIVTLANNVANSPVFLGLVDAFHRAALTPTPERSFLGWTPDLFTNTFVNKAGLPLPTVDLDAPGALMGRAMIDAATVADARWLFGSSGDAALWFDELVKRIGVAPEQKETRDTKAGSCSVLTFARADGRNTAIVWCQNVVGRIVYGEKAVGWRLNEAASKSGKHAGASIGGPEFVDESIDAIATAMQSRS
jgi:hypothetical protein